MSDVALGLLEFDSIALGIAAGDAMVKRAPIESIKAGTVQPGKYLVMVYGEVADVQESLDAGRRSKSCPTELRPCHNPSLAIYLKKANCVYLVV